MCAAVWRLMVPISAATAPLSPRRSASAETKQCRPQLDADGRSDMGIPEAVRGTREHMGLQTIVSACWPGVGAGVTTVSCHARFSGLCRLQESSGIRTAKMRLTGRSLTRQSLIVICACTVPVEDGSRERPHAETEPPPWHGHGPFVCVCVCCYSTFGLVPVDWPTTRMAVRIRLLILTCTRCCALDTV